MKVIELLGSLGNGETLVLGTDCPHSDCIVASGR